MCVSAADLPLKQTPFPISQPDPRAEQLRATATRNTEQYCWGWVSAPHTHLLVLGRRLQLPLQLRQARLQLAPARRRRLQLRLLPPQPLLQRALVVLRLVVRLKGGSGGT